jgi:LysR family transcriptional activator of nhaA
MQSPEWLNYHHLYYFWMTAREGSLSRAAERMKLTRSTLSAQIRALEEFLGDELFLRSGRALSLTALGADVLRYADDIFRSGEELVEMARAQRPAQRSALRVGVVQGMPKTIAYRLLEPALSILGHSPVCLRQDRFERLLDELTAGHLHLLLSDLLPPQGATASVFAQALFESPVCLYAAPALAQRYAAGFPDSLHGAPFLLPAPGTHLRELLERWLAARELRVCVEGEFDDVAMMRAFGSDGRGVFPYCSALAGEVEQPHGLIRLGELSGLVDRFYAISTQRRMHRAELRAVLERGRDRADDGLLRAATRPGAKPRSGKS